LPLLFALFISACNPGVFNDLKKDAPVLIIEEPSGYRGSAFGGTLAGFQGTLDDTAVSRLAVASGPDSAIAVLEGWDGTAPNPQRVLYTDCADVGECPAGLAERFVGIPSWASDALCVVAPAERENKIRVRCETPNTVRTYDAPAMQSVGRALADAQDGTVLLGAPTANMNKGALYRLNPQGVFRPFDFTAATLQNGEGLGTAVAVTAHAEERWIAVTSAAHRVIVGVENSGNFQIRACLQDSTDTFGETLAWGDVTGDRKPELFVNGGTPSRQVYVYDGDSLPTAVGCNTWNVKEKVECSDGLDDVSCAGANFASAFMVSDADGDGLSDLWVAAPEATVRGIVRAGAVFGYFWQDGSVASAVTEVLTIDEADEEDRFGAALAPMRTLGRDEIAVGAPGTSDLVIFYCTQRELSDLSLGPRCLPKR